MEATSWSEATKQIEILKIYSILFNISPIFPLKRFLSLNQNAYKSKYIQRDFG